MIFRVMDPKREFSAPLLELSRADKVRILAVTSGQRLHAAPEFPTVGEQGMPRLKDEGWFGLFAARATSDDIIDRIRDAKTLIGLLWLRRLGLPALD